MSIEDRLARLERENRRLKVAALLVLAVIGSVFVMGQARPPAAEIVAQRITITNNDGARIMEMKPDGSGLPNLSLYEPGGSTAVISLGMSTFVPSGDQPRRIAGPRLSLSSAHTGRAGVALSMMDETATVVLYDQNAQGRLLLDMSTRPSISIWNEQITRAIWEAP